MDRRSFEVIAKYIARTHDITIVWGDKGPCADPTTKTMWLTTPEPGKEMEAIVLLMHEAAHLAHTDIPKEGVYDNRGEFDIVNACEDIRIDNKNMRLLPNIDSFYREMYKGHKKNNSKKIADDPTWWPSIPLSRRSLIKGILTLEGMQQYSMDDAEAEKILFQDGAYRDMDELVRKLEHRDWVGAQAIVKALGQKLGISPDKEKEECKDSGPGEGGADGGNGAGSVMPGLGSAFKKGKDVALGTKPGVGEIVMAGKKATTIECNESTMTALKELLSESTTVRVDQPRILNTDNLTAFKLEDNEGLFYEEEEVKKLNSKVFFLLDGSGSMAASLMCGNSRQSVVAGCVEEVIKALDEAKNDDSANVEWQVFGFCTSLHTLDKDDWKKQYMQLSGGTSLLYSFEQAQEAMLKDTEIDGKKLIVIFTDGDVSSSEIDKIEEHILQYNEDVRCMIIGVGADPTGRIVKIIGEKNILAKDLSDVILAEAIMDMLA